MKKVFLLIFVMLSAMVTFAQEARRVAILETVDKQGNISYANKLILRANLAKAITNTPGYEAYDRTDMDAIMGEQDFQRTGMVSNDQIKRLGEMTGATYVLVAEAVYVDANTMFITAKLLDVETARTEVTDNQMMGATAAEIQRGCQLLADKLIKPIVVAKPKPTKQSKLEKTVEQEKVKEQEKAEEEVRVEEQLSAKEKAKAEKQAKSEAKEQAKAEKNEKKSKKDKKDEALLASMDQLQTVSVNDKPAVTFPQLIKVSNKEYRLGNTKMDKKAYENFIYENCPAAWKKYKNGKNAVATGWTFFVIGAAATIGGGVYFALNEKNYDLYREYNDEADAYRGTSNYDYYKRLANDYYSKYNSCIAWGIGLMGGGGGLAGIGLFTFIGGYGSKAAALKTYNKKCASTTPISLSLTAGQNGLGIAMNF